MWLDTDATITNTPTYIKHYLDYRFAADDDRGIVVAGDKGDHPHAVFNAGVFVVKNNLAGRSIVEEWSRNGWEFSEKYWTKQDGKWECSDEWAGSAYEQGFFRDQYMNLDTPDNDKRVDSVSWCVLQRQNSNEEQSVCRHQDVSVAVHFAGKESKGAIPEFLDQNTK